MKILRKVEYSNRGSIFKGFFHQWIIKKDKVGSDISFGLIEDNEGYLIEVSFDLIKFID
ncbi:hypothetical protein ACYSNX_02800 [Myroides sp. LJL115]